MYVDGRPRTAQVSVEEGGRTVDVVKGADDVDVAPPEPRELVVGREVPQALTRLPSRVTADPA